MEGVTERVTHAKRATGLVEKKQITISRKRLALCDLILELSLKMMAKPIKTVKKENHFDEYCERLEKMLLEKSARRRKRSLRR